MRKSTSHRPWNTSENALLRRLWSCSVSAAAIGVRLDRTRHAIIAHAHILGLPRRPQGRLPAQIGEGDDIVVNLPLPIAEVMQPAASRRSISLNTLCQLLLITIAAEGMIDAVLDDADETARAA